MLNERTELNYRPLRLYQTVFKRLAQRISGTARTPELDSATLSALFNMIHTDGLGTTKTYQFTPDDFALACELLDDHELHFPSGVQKAC